LTFSESTPDHPYFRLTIGRIIPEAKNFKVFVFREDHGISYEAGQFITLVERPGDQEIRRSYSICTSPLGREPLAIGVRRMPNGYFSRKLFDEIKEGDSVYCTGAAGFFRLPEKISGGEKLVMFAAGSGITPVISLIRTVLLMNEETKIELIYSNHRQESTAFFHELRTLLKQYPDRLHIHFLFSVSSDLRRARLNPDLLSGFMERWKNEAGKLYFYVCGPESYMRMIIFHLREEGFPADRIKKEDFNPGNKKIAGKVPADQSTHEVILEWKNRVFRFPVQYPDTILRAASRSGLHLPYSCETGKCGSCAVKCLEGKVWLSNNEVLLEKELSEGLILTCTGYPQYGDLRLRLE